VTRQLRPAARGAGLPQERHPRLHRGQSDAREAADDAGRPGEGVPAAVSFGHQARAGVPVARQRVSFPVSHQQQQADRRKILPTEDVLERSRSWPVRCRRARCGQQSAEKETAAVEKERTESCWSGGQQTATERSCTEVHRRHGLHGLPAVAAEQDRREVADIDP